MSSSKASNKVWEGRNGSGWWPSFLGAKQNVDESKNTGTKTLRGQESDGNGQGGYGGPGSVPMRPCYQNDDQYGKDNLMAGQREYYDNFSIDQGLLERAAKSCSPDGNWDPAATRRAEYLSRQDESTMAKVLVMSHAMAIDVMRAQNIRNYPLSRTTKNSLVDTYAAEHYDTATKSPRKRHFVPGTNIRAIEGGLVLDKEEAAAYLHLETMWHLSNHQRSRETEDKEKFQKVERRHIEQIAVLQAQVRELTEQLKPHV